MWTYAAPVADMLHLMTRVLDAPASWRQIPAFDGVDADAAAEVLAQAARFAGERLAPLNGPGDLAGCRVQVTQVVPIDVDHHRRDVT